MCAARSQPVGLGPVKGEYTILYYTITALEAAQTPANTFTSPKVANACVSGLLCHTSNPAASSPLSLQERHRPG